MENAKSNYDNGFGGGVTVRRMPVLSSYSKKVFWVDSSGGTNGDGSFKRPYPTIQAAHDVASAGDLIMCKEAHAETLSAAAALTLSTAGIAVIGLGNGDRRPTLTFGTSAAASVVISGANVAIENIVGVAAIDSLTNPFDIRAAGVRLDLEWKDTTDIEAISVVVGYTDQSADNLSVRLKYRGYTGGDACVAPIKLNGTDGARIQLDFYGKASTAVVQFVTNASKDVDVRGYVYNSGTTDGTKLVIDTITGSTWYAEIQDGGAGAKFSGGSGAALASDDVSSVSSALLVPSADAVTNVNERDVIGNKSDASVTTVGTTKSLMGYIKGAVSWLTVGVADAASNASAADVIGNKSDAAVTVVATTKSLMAYLKGIVNWLTVGVTDAASNASAADVVGNKSDAAVFTPGTTKSIIAYLKGIVTKGENISNVALANTDLTGTVTRYTITNGPIVVKHLGMLITTVLPAGANTMKFQFTPTGGGATDLCGATDTAAAAAQQLFVVDGTKATGLVKTTDVGILAAGQVEHMPLILGSGVITTVFSAGPPASGAAQLFMEWEPANRSAVVA